MTRTPQNQRNIAYGMAKKWRVQNEDAEELAQDVALAYAAGETNTNVKDTLIDAHRAKFGRKEKDKVTGEYLPFEPGSKGFARENTQAVDPKVLEVIGGSFEPLTYDAFLSIAYGLHGINRIATFLRYKWGLEDLEIAQMFGVTHSRVCQILAQAHREARALITGDAAQMEHPRMSVKRVREELTPQPVKPRRK